ncbi:HotDog domain-containing protein [Mycena albidolilacea]|uniref:HotDog domain-containing protein n=1 Tax=Mycena albidolilacea TaxID=1033008 RepID=A0AAD7EUJ2_9AGAR|nr:HotDog domain-containing protein [Mycena albidolilacea]
MSSSILLRRVRETCRLQNKFNTLRNASTSSTPPASRRLGAFATLSLVTAVSLSCYTLGAFYPPAPISLLYPRPAPPPPADPNSAESLAYTEALETKLQTLPLLRELRARADADEWYETRPYQQIPDEIRVNNFTAGSLRGPGRLPLWPLARVKKDESEAVVIIHIGRSLCGHDGIVHGGLLATLLDEALARNAITNLPEKVGVTATLSLNYRAPTRADQFVVVKTQLVDVKGRKATVSGRVEDLQGTLLVDATALFIQPRYAKMLDPQRIRQNLGAPATALAPVLLADGVKLPK